MNLLHHFHSALLPLVHLGKVVLIDFVVSYQGQLYFYVLEFTSDLEVFSCAKCEMYEPFKSSMVAGSPK